MIFYCYDLRTHGLIFKFSSPDDKHDCICSKNLTINEGSPCGKDRYYIVKENESAGLIFAICFDGVKVRKEANFLAKHTIDMYMLANPIIDAKHNHYEEIVKASIHNTKNLNSQITSKILNFLKEDSLSVAKDKVTYIDQIVKRDTKALSRELLSILTISSRISKEYNVIDYLKPNISLRKNEFGYKKLHSLLVLSFYQFESDFSNNGIYFKIASTDLSVYINFNTVQTLLTHLYINALKYCLRNSEVNVVYNVIAQKFVEVKFIMRSLELCDDIISNGRLNGVRSDQAKKMYEKGTGLGLGIIQSLALLNKGCFNFGRVSDNVITKEGYSYTDNYFSITLLKEEFY